MLMMAIATLSGRMHGAMTKDKAREVLKDAGYTAEQITKIEGK